jgi:hypothetical protein
MNEMISWLEMKLSKYKHDLSFWDADGDDAEIYDDLTARIDVLETAIEKAKEIQSGTK